MTPENLKELYVYVKVGDKWEKLNDGIPDFQSAEVTDVTPTYGFTIDLTFGVGDNHSIPKFYIIDPDDNLDDVAHVFIPWYPRIIIASRTPEKLREFERAVERFMFETLMAFQNRDIEYLSELAEFFYEEWDYEA